ncbi:hypothetical protein [Pseudoduganella violaceinigra]|uniref:hypothetical protein n=1 Tax=Pseudoduganella violaceinigra TaxID=246602 RepID=UPI0003FBEA92|nr:hypothetical protein [Pseudoduganella violaceinigra]
MQTQSSCSPSHDISAWRDQFRMTHTFHLSLGANEPIAGQLESTLKRSKARVEKWVISRRGGFYEHCITVEGIGDESARELRKELAGLNGEIKVHVEHMLHFGSEAGAR